MSKAPSMPLFWDAYLADTTHFSTEEHGAYFLLLGAMWRRNGWVPDDDKDNARIVGLTKGKWIKFKARIPEPIFEDGQISQKKLLKVWQNTQEKIEKNRTNGAKGGRPKANAYKDLAKANGFDLDNPNETIPEPEPEPDSGIGASYEAPRVSEAFEIYNLIAKDAGWPECQARNKTRQAKLKKRLKDCGGLEGWKVAMEKASQSDFLCNRAKKSFTATIDFFLQESSFTKLMEGNYDNRSNGSEANGRGAIAGPSRPGRGTAEAAMAVAARLSRQPEGSGADDPAPWETSRSGVADGPDDLFADPVLRKGYAASR